MVKSKNWNFTAPPKNELEGRGRVLPKLQRVNRQQNIV